MCIYINPPAYTRKKTFIVYLKAEFLSVELIFVNEETKTSFLTIY